MSHDPLSYAAQLRSHGAQLHAAGLAQQAALDSLAAEASVGALTVRVGLAGRLTGFVLDPDEERPSPTQLATSFSRAYDHACTLVVEATAAHSGGLDEAILALTPTAGTPEEASARPAEGSVSVDEADEPASDDPSTDDLPIDDAFNRLLETLDGEPEDIGTFLSDPLFKRFSAGPDPSTWQQDLQAQIAQLSAHSDELTRLATTTTGEHTDKNLTMQVSSAGRVLSLTFRPAAASLESDDLCAAVLEAYGEASEAAQAALQEAVAELGLPSTDDSPRW